MPTYLEVNRLVTLKILKINYRFRITLQNMICFKLFNIVN